MTILIVTTSFAAGWLLSEAIHRHQARKEELLAALTHAWQGRPADLSTAIRYGQGADFA